MTEKDIYAGFIVDLYEIRYPLIHANVGRLPQSMEEMHKYNFFNSVIAQLIDKYEVSDEDIRGEIRRREEAKMLESLEIKNT